MNINSSSSELSRHFQLLVDDIAPEGTKQRRRKTGRRSDAVLGCRPRMIIASPTFRRRVLERVLAKCPRFTTVQISVGGKTGFVFSRAICGGKDLTGFNL